MSTFKYPFTYERFEEGVHMEDVCFHRPVLTLSLTKDGVTYPEGHEFLKVWVTTFIRATPTCIQVSVDFVFYGDGEECLEISMQEILDQKLQTFAKAADF